MRKSRTESTLNPAQGRAKWEKFAEDHHKYQMHNPFNSDAYVPAKALDKSDVHYGKPPEGSLTEKRGIKAHAHISGEVVELCHTIQSFGTKQQDGSFQIKFGFLFNIYNKISNKLVGVLLRARKHGFVSFPGEMLYQRQDDDVVITLLYLPDEQLFLMYK